MLTVLYSGLCSKEAGEHVVFTWKDWFWPVINFAFLLFILLFFARKPFAESFRNRTELIEKSLKEATEAKELAQKSLNEVRERLKNTDIEIGQILNPQEASEKKKKRRGKVKSEYTGAGKG